MSVLLVVVLVVAVVAVLLRSLGDAALFFYEVDRAVELRSELDVTPRRPRRDAGVRRERLPGALAAELRVR